MLDDLHTKQEQFAQAAANLAFSVDLGVGPGTPDGRPMAATFSTGEGDVLAAVITAGKPFLLMAKLHNGNAAQMELKQFRIDVPTGWKSELFMDKLPKTPATGDGCALTFRVTPPIDAQPTKAYFHRDDPETDAIYKIRQSAVRDARVAAPARIGRSDL